MRAVSGFENMKKGFDLSQAMAEADRCLLCHDAPCSEGCPADTKPAEFIRKLRFKNITGAIRTIKANNIMGGACGVLCPTAQLCEEKCSAMFKSQNRPEGADRQCWLEAERRVDAAKPDDNPATGDLTDRDQRAAA